MSNFTVNYAPTQAFSYIQPTQEFTLYLENEIKANQCLSSLVEQEMRPSEDTQIQPTIILDSNQCEIDREFQVKMSQRISYIRLNQELEESSVEQEEKADNVDEISGRQFIEFRPLFPNALLISNPTTSSQLPENVVKQNARETGQRGRSETVIKGSERRAMIRVGLSKSQKIKRHLHSKAQPARVLISE